MNESIRNIFKDGIIDLSDWALFKDKNDYETKYFSKYYKKTFDGKVVSIGIFYKHFDLENIDYVAWGYFDEENCSFNAKVNGNKIEKIISGCPCFEEVVSREKTFWEKYKTIFIVLGLVVLMSALFSLDNKGEFLMSFMVYYMSSFFLIFGALKFISFPKFREMFKTYDPIAKVIPQYGYVYPYMETLFGICIFLYPANLYLNLTIIFVLAATTLGIVGKLNKKEKLSCACLGGAFSVPLSYITVAENVFMILMSAFMISMYF